MHGRHMKKAPKLFVIRGAAALILVLALSISSFATVTVSYTHLDVYKRQAWSKCF